MFCENCGQKIKDDLKFCTECGHSVKSMTIKDLKERWYHRFLRVLYIISYIPLLLIIPIVWSGNNSSYVCSGLSFKSYLNDSCHYVDTYGKAFLWSLITLAIYMIIIRLIKIAVIYIIIGKKPEWKKEFKKLF